MQKIEAIEQGIATGNVKKLRSTIGSLSYTNRDFSSGLFDEAVEYVESKGIALKESYDGRPLISETKSTYTDDDFSVAIFELEKNFCDERIRDLQKIGKALYGNKPKPVQPSATERQNTNSTSHNGANRNQTGKNPNQASQSSGARMGVLAVIIIAIIVAVVKLLK